jgi:hypothetical protein
VRNNISPEDIQNIKNVDINNPPKYVEFDQEYMENYAQQYSQSLTQIINKINASNNGGYYNPLMGSDFTQSINISPLVPTQTQLTEWLKNPAKHQKSLRDVSQFLNGAIMQYNRSIKHFSSILTYRYDLRPLNRIPKDAEGKKRYLASMDTCNNLLRKLNIKYQMEKVVQDVMQNGVGFWYIKDTKHFRTLYPLPRDYCYITGYWDNGYTFAIDLSFFNKFVGLAEVIPELTYAYEMFIKMRELGVRGDRLAMYQYYPMPIESSWVFMFDPLHADASPPLKSVFKDAFEILSYKDLLKQKTILDTVTLLFQQIPYDETSKKFIMEYNEAAKIVATTQQLLPKGVRTLASPFSGEQFNFTQAQSMNNINGVGETLYWSSVGINSTMMGGETKSALVLKQSLESDFSYCDHLYRQIENFINWQLMLASREFIWATKFYGNRFTEGEDIDRELKIVTTTNAPIEKLYALRGYEPFEIDPILDLELELDRKSRLKPIISGNQMSGKDIENGRPKLSDDSLGEAGNITRDNDSNSNKI